MLKSVPELPEVETVANGVDARVRELRIVSVWTSGKPQTFKSTWRTARARSAMHSSSSTSA